MGADYLLRVKKNSFTLYDESGKKIEILPFLEPLNDKEPAEKRGIVRTRDKTELPVRLCAIRKTPEAIVATSKRICRQESKRQEKVSPEAKAFNEYIIVVTSLPETISIEQVLEIYRLRWQIEIHFKRLKSILDCGELPKRNDNSVKAWLNGKLMIALLIEFIISEAAFPPQDIGQEKYLA
jgi:transposase